MGTCAQCNSKIEIVESDPLISKQSVFQKLKELNQNTKSTIFLTMRSNKKIDNENQGDQSFLVSEVNDEQSDVKNIHGSVKIRQRKYSFQEQQIQQVHFHINDQNDSAKVRCFRFTDPNIPRNLSNSSSSNSQFKEFNAHFKKSDKQIIESDESKSIKSILKKEPRQKSETKSVRFAKNISTSQTRIKSKSCHHKQHKKKKKIQNQIQRYEHYQF
ncbi:unnamed protein product (macronuclear) [Paramecium tetraurelia]|uniref:Uncharacterized protein n=1 Tax=Paramecium tetraurelia TaxID=5888 RepID=A0E2W7_PARTE|nr:uncharacterized protein GSPATT00022806001 [Paramecium tetraurelia]CAK89634.1 unnamed protein product [Paramecium tetraurelia]|eukprot:XP_001457031.1 hypothetical protein (macronuclear) [Paramecium tetraurelia strain d4-2]